MSFSFEGDFKTRPKVSLGGASKKDERRRLKNAIIIQSYIRGYHDRKQQYAYQRGNFDRCVCQAQSEGGPPMSDAAILSLLTRQLLFFYRQSEDSQRLIWICQNLVKHNGQFVKLLAGPKRQTLLQTCKDDSLNVAVPMRMLEIFSTERTYLPVLEDINCVASLIEQILHYMVQKGYYRSLYILVNHKLPSSLEQFVFEAFTEEFISAPFTEQIFHFFIPALSDPRLHFPFEAFLGSLQATEGLQLYLRALQALLPLLPVSESTSRPEVISDSEDEEDTNIQAPSTQLITEECIHKLDTKQQTNALLNLVWRDSASEEVFTMMASICHTLMASVQSMVPLLQVISRGSPMSLEDSNRIIPLFYLFSSLFSHSNTSMMPFMLSELVNLSRLLRDACLGIIKLAYPETKTEHREEYMAAFRSVGVKTNIEVQQRIQAEQKRWVQLFKVITNLVKMVKARDIRRPFCPAGHWLSEEVNIRADKVTQLYVPSARHPPQLSVSEERHLAILTELPFVIFQRLIYADKRDIQGDGPLLDGIIKRVRVHLLNAHGLDEAGIDGGGIFREFLNELLKSGFNPNQGFFKTTNDGLLYPSPTAQMLVGDSFARHYYFLGRILGKALYENMLVELPFASFFLSKLLGTSADVDIHHLASLDPEMYRNLLFLKSYEDDVEDLGLNFTIVVELKPEGKDIPVSTANRIAYIHLVADYRLNKQIRPHCLAFRQGLANVVNLEWLRMFDQQEIQVLISGAHVPICLDDLKTFTNYSGGYTATHPVITIFWEVVESFTDEEKRKLLKFVTSCSRPPLLGFKELYPAFCIHNGGNDLERLPTASTCMNLLKLPEFCDQHLMRNKLLYAIESSAGFELS
ncbi:unnamed protein product [Coregonus sp. 'balchen']|nr:unnamed protein product [Coregonus sp. 'balchen']